MAPRVSIEKLCRKHLGEKNADALLAKIDRMIKQKKSAAEIERAIAADIAKQIEKEIVSAVVSRIGPVAPSKKKHIAVDIRATTRAIAIEPDLSASIQGRIVGRRVSVQAHS